VDTDGSMSIPESVKNGAVYIMRWERAAHIPHPFAGERGIF